MISERQANISLFRWLAVSMIVFCLAAGLFPGSAQAAAPIISGSPPSGQVGSPYSASFTASCNSTACIVPGSWYISGSIPGLSVPTNSNTIQGIPSTANAYEVQVSYTDPTLGIATKYFTIIITTPALVFSTTSIPMATVGMAYSASVVATGGTGSISYALTNGALPSGLSFNNGQVSGIPARG
ncbi:MAG: putative Ig domain-containing protein, partial [Chloroflexi bacterium]|nr:putative Ig domain-containing protein [Chloroflexota bacterium]